MNFLTLQQGQSYRGQLSSKITDYLLEDCFLTTSTKQRVDLDLPDTVSSTIAIATSYNGQLYASTHGDHTVKVFQFATNTCIRVFNGHPRTPWTVKFNQADQDIIASGCLGCQVRVWSIKQNNCLGVIRLQFPIISLSFHKSGDYIAAASGSTLEIWKWKITCDYDNVVQGRNKTSVTPPMVMSSNVVEGNGVGGAFAPATRNTRQYMLRPITHGRNIRAVLFHPNGDYLLIAAPEAPRLASDKLTYCSLFAVKLTTLFHASTQNDGPPPPIDLSSYPSILPQIHLYSDGGIDISRDGKYLITCARLQSPPLWLSSQNVTSLSASAFSPMSTTDGMDAYMSQSNVFRQLSTHPMSLNWEGRTGIQDSPPRPPPISWTGGWTTEMDMSQSDSLGSSLFNVGRTTNSANRPLHRMVSMEQGNTQESSLPSSQPFGGWSMELSQSDSLPPPSSNSSMEWKPLTSQLPNFSSTFPNIVSQESINGQSLIPSTQSSMSQSMPKKHGLSYGYLDTLDSSSSVNKKTAMDMDEHLEEEYLNPSYLWTNPAWKNQLNTIQSHCYPYGTTNEPAFKACTAVISNVSNDNNSGYSDWNYEEYLCIFQFQFDEEGDIHCPKLHNAKLLPGQLIHAITSVRISPTGRYALLGFGVRNKENIVEGHVDPKAVCEIIALHKPELDTVSIISDDDDEVNIAQFHPHPGLGLLYGTKRGKVRVFNRCTGCEDDDDIVESSWV